MTKVIYKGLNPELYGRPLWESMPDDNDPTSGLLWAEIKHICKAADLTLKEYEIITLYYQGWSQQDIGLIQGISQQAVSKQQKIIFAKMSKVKWRGLITVVVEACGWSGLKWVLRGTKPTDQN